MKNTILIFVSILFLSACKPILFTNSTRIRIQKEDQSNIEKIQFFNDKKIVLMYKTTSQEEVIKGGKVKFQNGYYYNYIEIPKRTPAIAKHLDFQRLKVYFETGSDRYLVFGKSKSTKKDYYQLFGTQKTDGFYVNFEGKSFKVIEGSFSFLMIKKNTNIDIQSDKRKLKGVKIK